MLQVLNPERRTSYNSHEQCRFLQTHRGKKKQGVAFAEADGASQRGYLRFEVCPPLFEVQFVVLVYVGGLQRFLNINYFLAFEGEFVQHLLVALKSRETDWVNDSKENPLFGWPNVKNTSTRPLLLGTHRQRSEHFQMMDSNVLQ